MGEHRSGSRRVWTAVCLLACSLLLAAAPAPAQAPGAEKDDAANARALFDEGVALFAEERYPAALAKFEASYALRPATVVLYNLAGCRKATGDYVGAIAAFEEYLEKRKERLTVNERKDIETQVDEMSRSLGRIEIRGKQRDVRILLDGNERGKTPLAGPIPVNPGRRKVVFVAEGLPPVIEILLVDAGRTVIVDLDALLPIAKPPEPETVPASPAPAKAAPEEDGPPADAFKPAINDEDTEVADEKEGARPAAVVLGIFLTTSVLVGFSSIFVGLEANDTYEGWKDHPTPENRKVSEDWRNLATFMFAATGALGAGALISGIVWGVQVRKEREAAENGDGVESSADIAAWLLPTPGGASLTVGGAF